MNSYKIFIILVISVFIAIPVPAQETTLAPQSAMLWGTMPWGSSAMQRSMDPQTYNTLLKLMTENPAMMQSPTALCAQCHDGEAMQRYEKTLFPMYRLMMNPTNWMNPNAYRQAMTPVMDPKTYTEWYNAMMKMMNPGSQYGNQQQ